MLDEQIQQSRSFPSVAAEPICSDLAKHLKDGTRVAHQSVEQVKFVHEFIKGNIHKEAYCQLLVNLCEVYHALEQELNKNQQHRLLQPVHFPLELHRSAALNADINYFGGAKELRPTNAAVQYAKRLRDIGSSHPELLVSHAYARYLGDLSGGRILKRALMKGLQLTDDGIGLQFYNFSLIKDVPAFKNMYRAQLDKLPVQHEIVQKMVAEANIAFEMNRKMFVELDEAYNATAPAALDFIVPAARICKKPCSSCPFAVLAQHGYAMPFGHPEVKDIHVNPNLRTCPLKLLGDTAPRVVLFMLPMAFGVMCAICKSRGSSRGL